MVEMENSALITNFELTMRYQNVKQAFEYLSLGFIRNLGWR